MNAVILGCMASFGLFIVFLLKINPGNDNLLFLLKGLWLNKQKLQMAILIVTVLSIFGGLCGFGVALLIGYLMPNKEFSLVKEQIIAPVITKTFPDKKFFLQGRANSSGQNFLIITKENNRLSPWELREDQIQIEIIQETKKPAVMQIFSSNRFGFWGITLPAKKYKIFIPPDSILYVPDVEE